MQHGRERAGEQTAEDYENGDMQNLILQKIE